MELLFILLFAFVPASWNLTYKHSFGIDYDNSTFLLDGEPFRYISGSIHYFRIHPSQWLDRLKKVRALGFNAIQYYIPWNFHENEEGQFEFQNDRNFTEFSAIAEKLGLYTLLRIGPYICAEWENGGLPWWLLNKGKNIKQRSSDKRFTQAVEKWFKQLLPIVKSMLRERGGPVLMVQVENEYGSYDACDRGYTIWLRDLVRHHLGYDVILYTTDGHEERYLKCGSIPEVFPTVDFGVMSNAEIDRSFEIQRKFQSNGTGPLVNSEFYPGWFLMWGTKEQTLPSQNSMINALKYMYSIGANINFYMIHGGTNFEFWNGAEPEGPLITSYDYSAPITEAGDITSNYIAIRNWIKTIPNWKNSPTSIPNNSTKRGYGLVRMSLYARFDESMCMLSKKTKYPLTFEEMMQPYGLVAYMTNVSFCGKNLKIESLKDFGYVYLNKVYQGTFIHRLYDRHVSTVELKSCPTNQTILIIVENQGRQTYETINDYKGILSNVTLDGMLLTDWSQCPLSFVREFASYRNIERDNHNPGEAGIYIGQFMVDKTADTFINTTDWGKGHIIINGHKIGRYWSAIGPQLTLYVPAQYLKAGKNEIVIVEMEGKKEICNGHCYVSAIDTPIFTITQTIKSNVAAPVEIMTFVMFAVFIRNF